MGGAFLKHVVVPGSLQDKSRTERCNRVRRAAAGQHRRQRRWCKLGRHRLAALGWGNGPLQRRDRADARPPCRCFCRQHHRRPVNVEGAASVVIFFYEKDFGVEEDDFRAGRTDLASQRQALRRCCLPPRAYQPPSGQRSPRWTNVRLPAFFSQNLTQDIDNELAASNSPC